MLILIIVLLVIIIFVVVLKLWLGMRLKGYQSSYELTKDYHGNLLKEYQKLYEINTRISGEVQGLVELYEVTRELTKYLTANEVFAVFQERLKKDIILDDCKLLKPEIDLAAFADYQIFPLKIAEDLMGHLVLKGLKPEDNDKFHILFNQLFLVLKRVRLYEKIEELSIMDSLTGLYLRRYLQEKLDEEITRCNKFGFRFVFLMLDLDRFKSYNDRYGHLVGDVLLSTVAKIIKDNVRQIDIVARYGGEEFSIILPGTDKEEAEYVSLRLRQEIEKSHIRAYDEDLQITVSIGGSIFPKDATNAEELINKSDQALYRAKQAGRNRVCFWEEEVKA